MTGWADWASDTKIKQTKMNTTRANGNDGSGDDGDDDKSNRDIFLISCFLLLTPFSSAVFLKSHLGQQ